jgi:TP901 family phage tail tape measure protein
MADDLTLTAYLKADASGMTGGFQQATQAMSGFKNAASTAGGGLKGIESDAGRASGVLGAMGGIAGVAATAVVALGVAALGVGIKATKMAADYEQSMLKVQALTGASTDQMKQFDSGLKQLSMETGVVPKQLSEGLYNVVSAGYQGKDAMTLLALATKDSVIGMTDASVTTKSLTALLAQFSLGAGDANRVNGEMLETVTLGSGTFEQYAQNIVKSASAASQFHESMETMNAAYATLTSSQISAGNASTDFQQSLKVLDGNIGVVSKSLSKNGIAFDEAKFNAMDYGHKVVYLNSALEEANQKHVHITGITVQAAQAIDTISKHIDVYNKNLTTLSDKQAMAQKTQEAWSVTVGGFNVSMQRLKATMQVVMIDIGQRLLPIATGGVNLLNNAFQGLMSAGTYVGNVLKSLDLSDFNTAWIDVKEAVNEVGQAFQVLGARLNPIKGDFDPLADAIAGIAKGGLGILTNLLWKAYEGISAFAQAINSGKGPLADFANAFKDFGPPLQNIANLMVGELKRAFGDFGALAKQVGGWFMSDVVPAIKAAWPGFHDLAMTILNTVIPAFFQIRSVVMDVIEHAFKTFGPIVEKIVPPLIRFAGILAGDVANGLKVITPYVVDAAKAIGKFADDIMTRVAPIVSQWITALMPLVQMFADNWNKTWPTMANYLKGTWDVIVGVVKIAWALVSGYIKIGLDIMSGNWGQAWNDFKDTLGGVWDGIKTMLKGAIEQVVALLHPLLESLSHVPGPAGDMARGVLNAFDGMKDGSAQKSAEMKTKVLDNTAKMHMEAVSHLEQMRQDLLERIKNTTDPVAKHALEMKLKTVDHMEEMHTQAAGKAEEMKKKVVSHAKDMKEQSQGGIAGVGKYFGDKFNEAKNAIVGAFGNVGKWFQDRWHDVQGAFGATGQWFQDRWSEAWKAIVGFFGPIGKWFHDRWNDVKESTKPFREFMGAVFETIGRIVHAAFGKVGQWFHDRFQEAKNKIVEVFGPIGKWFHDRWNDVTKIFQTVGGWFHDRFTEARNQIVAVFTSIGQWFSDRWKDVTKIFQAVGGWFHDRWQEAWNKTVEVFTPIGQWFQDRWNDVQNIFKAVGGWFHDRWQEAWNGITTFFAPIGQWFTDRWTDILTSVNTFKDSIIGKFGDTKIGVTNVFRDMVNGIIDLLNDGIGAVESFINFVGQGLNSVAAALGTKGTIPVAHLGRIPHFAEGVENFKGGLALVGERGPELAMLPRSTSVLDNSKTSALMSQAKSTFQYPTPGSTGSGGPGGGGSSPVIHVHVHPVIQPNDIYMDKHKVTDIITRHQADMIRLKGGVRRQ